MEWNWVAWFVGSIVGVEIDVIARRGHFCCKTEEMLYVCNSGRERLGAKHRCRKIIKHLQIRLMSLQVLMEIL